MHATLHQPHYPKLFLRISGFPFLLPEKLVSGPGRPNYSSTSGPCCGLGLIAARFQGLACGICRSSMTIESTPTSRRNGSCQEVGESTGSSGSGVRRIGLRDIEKKRRFNP